MSTNREDLRVRRTRKSLQDALLDLMGEKTFQEIQISEIARRAQVSRPAFYLHFHSKEELLLSYVDSIFAEFHTALVAQAARRNSDPLHYCVMLFKYWERYADTLRRVIEAEIPDMLLDRLRDYVTIVMEDLAASSGRVVDVPMREFVVNYVAGGAYMLLTQWILQNQPYSAKTMGLLFYQLSFPRIAALDPSGT